MNCLITTSLTSLVGICLIVLCRASPAGADPGAVADSAYAVHSGFHVPVPLDSTNTPYGHYIFLPESYGKKECKYPLLIFLHGSGERANSGEDAALLDKVLVHGPPKMIQQGTWSPGEEMIVISPQCHERWWNSDRLMQLITSACSAYAIEESRIYLTGLSMGGFGVFEFLSAFGAEAKIAAAVAICGAGPMDEVSIRNLSHTPLWVFHGEADKNVSPEYATQVVPAINALKPKVSAKLTMYPGIAHDSWTMTYEGTGMGKGDPDYDTFDQDVFSWMLQFSVTEPETVKPMNYVVIFCDDLGYGDLGVFGHPTIRTPHIDRMAMEGQKWTNFYAASSVCTPSRAGLLTGRLPIRSGMSSNQHRVLFPDSKGGLPQTEITLARQLKTAGYHTACIGKWHLGHADHSMPLSHGFDYFYGIKYSNDMDRTVEIPYEEAVLKPRADYFQTQLLRNNEVVELPADQSRLTANFTREAVKFIREQGDAPFFLYLAQPMPHVPLYRSSPFEDISRRGIYGDVIEELDWSVGKILEAIESSGLRDRTLVVFTSDNGPWLTFETHGGSAGILRDGKGSTFEGGMRVPAVFWSPSWVRPEVIMETGSTLDLFATLSSLSGIPLPDDRIYDSYDLSPILKRGKEIASDRKTFFYYRGTRIYAVRHGKFKAHFWTQSAYGGDAAQAHPIPLLFNLDVDPAEQFDVAGQYPEVIDEIRRLVDLHQKTVEPVVNQLDLY